MVRGSHFTPIEISSFLFKFPLGDVAGDLRFQQRQLSGAIEPIIDARQVYTALKGVYGLRVPALLLKGEP